jgi:hypothetical protein
MRRFPRAASSSVFLTRTLIPRKVANLAMRTFCAAPINGLKYRHFAAQKEADYLT